MPADVRALKWGEKKVQVGDGISEEEERIIEARMKELDLILKSEKRRATYKIEVVFNRERSFHRPFGGIVTWWESGNKLHGGGDTKLYLCPGKERKKNGCEAPLNESAHSGRFVICATCGSLWEPHELHGEVYYKLPMEKWADVLLSWFVKFGLDADIRLKYAVGDIRSAAMKEQEKQHGGEILFKVRDAQKRAGGIYTLDRIIKDTSAGADLRSRLLAFLKA